MKVKSLGPGMPTSSLHHPDAQQGLAGLPVSEQQKRYILTSPLSIPFFYMIVRVYRRAVYGPNYIHVPVKGVMKLLLLEVLNPFYIFQVASIIIWIMINYYYFAGAIFVMSAAGIIITITQTRKVKSKFV